MSRRSGGGGGGGGGSDDRRVYVGNLHQDIRSRDLEGLFESYGRIVDVNLVSGRYSERAPFAFVEFEDPRDARDAVDRRDGYFWKGRKLRVEFPRGERRAPGGGGGGGGGGGFSRGANSRGQAVRRTKYRVMVAGLPASASWQDLKDHMRSAGEVAFSDVFKDGSGVVEFTSYEGMRHAIKNLEESKLKSHEGESGYIRLKEDYDSDVDNGSSSRGGGGGRGGGGRGGRSRSRSRSPRSRSKSRSRSRTPVRKSRGSRATERDSSKSPPPATSSSAKRQGRRTSRSRSLSPAASPRPSSASRRDSRDRRRH